MPARQRVKGYEMLDRLTPCPVCGSLQWWFDGEEWPCWEWKPPAAANAVRVTLKPS